MWADPTTSLLLLCFAALVGGAINAIAGGGTLLTFPALLGVLPPGPESTTVANATSKVAIVPGTFAGAFGYRQELAESRRLIYLLMAPSLIGGVLGSLLVTRLDPRIFAALVPWLILIAALLLLVQQPIARWAKARASQGQKGRKGVILAVSFQFLVALYGGYFGAGIGILMLTALGFMGLRDIHHMNAVKNLLASLINGISAVTFIVEGRVRWDFAVGMAIGSVIGGYFGARWARRLPADRVRWMVVVIGIALSAYYFHKQFFASTN